LFSFNKSWIRGTGRYWSYLNRPRESVHKSNRIYELSRLEFKLLKPLSLHFLK
jgi:hypothetical protein